MADNVNLEAREHEGRGENAARRLRAGGMVPAVLHGGEDGQSTAVAVPTKMVACTLPDVGDNALYDVNLGGQSSTIRVVDVQRNPLTGALVHVDFAPVNMRERVVVTVPLTLAGEAPGAAEGAVVDQVAYEIEVETLPGDIPGEATLDVSDLQTGENLTLSAVRLPEGVELVSDPEEVAATVTAPTEISEEELEEAGIVEEPSGDEAALASTAPDTAAGTSSAADPDSEFAGTGSEEVRGEERSREVSAQEGEGPAGQNLQP